MKRIAFLVLVSGLVLWTAACSGVTKLDLGNSGRGVWQRPDDVVAALGIAPGQTVADIGAGEGYFVPYLAAAVGTEGAVYAVDVEDDIVEALSQRFAGDDSIVRVVRGQYADPQLPDGTIDLVLMVNTYHHIEDRRDYFQRLRADLSPGGRVAVLEPNEELGGLLSLALDEGHTSVAAEVEREMREAGYEVAARHEFLPVQIFRVFAAASEDAAPQ